MRIRKGVERKKEKKNIWGAIEKLQLTNLPAIQGWNHVLLTPANWSIKSNMKRAMRFMTVVCKVQIHKVIHPSKNNKQLLLSYLWMFARRHNFFHVNCQTNGYNFTSILNQSRSFFLSDSINMVKLNASISNNGMIWHILLIEVLQKQQSSHWQSVYPTIPCLLLDILFFHQHSHTLGIIPLS